MKHQHKSFAQAFSKACGRHEVSPFRECRGKAPAGRFGGSAGVRWTPLPQAEAPTEPAGETGYHPPATRISARTKILLRLLPACEADAALH